VATEARVSADSIRRRSENERIFHEAQRAADTVFAHYQLSQILATHEAPAALAGAILDELMHLCQAESGALWINDPRSGRAVMAASRGPTAPPLRARETPSLARVTLDDRGRQVAVVAVRNPPERPLEPDGVQFLSHVRHELAVALRGAQLREALDLERAELRAVFEGAGDAIVLVDEQRRVVRINSAASGLLQVTPDGASGRACEDVLSCHAEGVNACRDGCPFAHVLTTGEPVGGHERTLGTDPSSPIHVVGSYALASRSAGGASMAVAVFRDTTQMVELQELRRGFVATVSHELRTPLALIKGYVETLLALDVDPAMSRSYLERIDATVDRLTRLVGQTLDVTQLAAGQMTLERSAVQLTDVIGAALDDLRSNRPTLAIITHLDAHLPLISADQMRLRQVLDNILENAAKYGPGEGPVELTARQAARGIIVRVSDRGMGVPADERNLVFEQFHRGRNVRESARPGYGLGLTISRRIVEAHGGTLAIEPGVRGGTTIVMSLPLAPPVAGRPGA
jgi:two-component system phosphate regulon sensor histidine kinase PhoR